MSKITYIYALIDPRDQTQHYIGKTVQSPPKKRLRQHLLHPATDGLAEWFSELEHAGHKPELKILETVPVDGDWRAAEIYWIRYALAQGWYLRNKASGGDNYPLEILAEAQPDDIIPRVLYADEATLKLITGINSFVMKGKTAEDHTFRDLLHHTLVLLEAENTDHFEALLDTFCERTLSRGLVQMGRGWRIPVLKQYNRIDGEFFTVRQPFRINGIGIAGKWDASGWRNTLKMYKRTSDLLDDLATEIVDEQRRGYADVLQRATTIIAETFDKIAKM